MTFGRWAMACILGCGAIAVLLLPPSLSEDDRFNRSRFMAGSHRAAMEGRARLQRWHGLALWRAYQSARTIETARRVFQSTTQRGTASLIWFDRDVSEAARRYITTRVAAERAARGEWNGHGPTTLLVETDTATDLDGVQTPWGVNGSLSVSTQILPLGAIGDRCVTVVRLGHDAAVAPLSIRGDRSLMDGCAFYDAFGTPGPQIRAWLDGTRFMFARALSIMPPDTTSARAPRLFPPGLDFESDARVRCAGDDLNACSAVIQPVPADRYFHAYWGFDDRSVPFILESTELFGGPVRNDNGLLDALARDLGPARFERLWQSQRPLADAYFDVTGESFPEWIHRWLVSHEGIYRIGPLPSPTAILLTLVAIAIMFGASAHFARRPRAT